MHAVSLSPARRAALTALARIRRDGAYSGAALNTTLTESRLTGSDGAFATRLLYGTVTYEGVIDDMLAGLVSGRLEPQVRDVLRMAVYELLLGDSPAYAIIDQAVGAVRSIRPQAAGLANAVLRRCAERRETFPWGDPASDRDALGRATGHPRWIVDLFLDTYGDDVGGAALRSGAHPAPTFVRLDPFAVSRDDALATLEAAEPTPVPIDEDCFELTHPAMVLGRPHEGFFAMDAAAQMAPAACAPAGGMAILDVGAGRGNKTIAVQSIAMRTGAPALITALDVHPGKSAALERRIAASRVPEVRILTGDALELEDAVAGESYDAVLLDAPCTGLGTLRRYPEKRWRLDAADPGRMARLQDALLAASARVVRPGGCVVYSTCSVAPVENTGVVERFLRSASGATFVIEPVTDRVPEGWKHFVDTSGQFQSLPATDGPDGHFVAVLRRDR